MTKCYLICYLNIVAYLLQSCNIYPTCIGIAPDGSDMDRRTVKEGLLSAYQIHMSDRLKQEIHADDNCTVKNTAEDKHFGDWSTTWWEQFTILLKRGVKERKYESFSGVKIAQVLMVSLIIGLLWWQCDESHLQDKVSSYDASPSQYKSIIFFISVTVFCRLVCSSSTRPFGVSSLFSKPFSPSLKNE